MGGAGWPGPPTGARHTVTLPSVVGKCSLPAHTWPWPTCTVFSGAGGWLGGKVVNKPRIWVRFLALPLSVGAPHEGHTAPLSITALICRTLIMMSLCPGPMVRPE